MTVQSGQNCLRFKARLDQCAVHSGPLKARFYHYARHYGPLKARPALSISPPFLLPPFTLIRDFGKQNTRGNVSKISVSLACYWQIGSKSTNHSPIAWRREGKKVTLVAAIGGFPSELSITLKTETLETFPGVFCFPKSRIKGESACKFWS